VGFREFIKKGDGELGFPVIHGRSSHSNQNKMVCCFAEGKKLGFRRKKTLSASSVFIIKPLGSQKTPLFSDLPEVKKPGGGGRAPKKRGVKTKKKKRTHKTGRSPGAGLFPTSTFKGRHFMRYLGTGPVNLGRK